MGVVFILVDITISSEDGITETDGNDSYMPMEPSSGKDARNAPATTPTSSTAEYMDMSPSTPQGRPNWFVTLQIGVTTIPCCSCLCPHTQTHTRIYKIQQRVVIYFDCCGSAL